MNNADVREILDAQALQEIAKDAVEHALHDPRLPAGTTAIVLLCRPPLHGCFAKGPDWKAYMEPVAEGVHAVTQEIARKRA